MSLEEKREIPNDLVTVQKAAEITGFSVAYLRKIIRQNKVATFRHGEKRLLVSPQQIRSLAVPQTSWWPGTLANY